MNYTLKNIFCLGLKELQGLFRDYLLVGLIVYSFSLGIFTAYQAQPDSLTKAAIAIVDEDNSQLSKRIADAFFPPMFTMPDHISRPEIDSSMDRGDYTFVLVIPAEFQKDFFSAAEYGVYAVNSYIEQEYYNKKRKKGFKWKNAVLIS